MKHLKLFENIKSVSSIKDAINKYKSILVYIKPAVIDRYLEITNDPEMDYGQDIADKYGGNSYYVIHDINRIVLREMSFHDDKIFFTLEYYDDDDELDTFYVPFTDEELKNAILKLDSNKYNI